MPVKTESFVETRSTYVNFILTNSYSALVTSPPYGLSVSLKLNIKNLNYKKYVLVKLADKVFGKMVFQKIVLFTQ